MSGTFVKSFQDRYAQLREFHFLDLLNQMGAPVPEVLANDLPSGQITMSRAGQDLQTWLHALPATEDGAARAASALSQAVAAVLRLAELGVWQLDIALRNFVVEDQGAGPFVRMIDFSLAVSPRFPAQKPLWMRPDPATQHPALAQALQADWEAFFKRHALPLPHRWNTEFEIPSLLYQADWGEQLAIDRIKVPWCVAAHGVGMMVETGRGWPYGEPIHQPNRDRRDGDTRSMMNLWNEGDALASLRRAQLSWQAAAQLRTPRPVAREAKLTQSAVHTRSTEPPDALTPTGEARHTGHLGAVGTSERDSQALATGASSFQPAQLEYLVQPEQPAAGAQFTGEPATTNTPGAATSTIAGDRPWWRLAALAIFIGTAHVVNEAIYASQAVGVTRYTLGVVLVASMLTAGTLLIALLSASPRRWLLRLGQLHGLILAALALELWARGLPLAVWGGNLAAAVIVTIAARPPSPR